MSSKNDEPLFRIGAVQLILVMLLLVAIGATIGAMFPGLFFY